ncbi:MAG: AMIN-like domain-containing (lipo)protein [Oryzihumus sp.]
MRVVRRLLVLLLALGAALPLSAPTAGAATPVVPTLVGIRAAHHPTFDRVVFDFAGGLPASRQVTWVTQLVGDASGLPVPVAGRAVLQVRFAAANAHDAEGRATAPSRVAFALPNAVTVVQSGDFEAVTTYGIGVASRQAVHVTTLTSPSRVVVDVGAAFPTVLRQVWFFNQPRFVANTEPFFTPVLRPVLPLTPATGLMDRIFAGPTTAERAAGLRQLSSGATGFRALSVSGGVARVQLTGGCSSGGSTVTIAGEILPTLRQLFTVDWVKVYDPSGHTLSPTGNRDSVPACLEP